LERFPPKTDKVALFLDHEIMMALFGPYRTWA
jgi:hypothetical protein